jgi:hypothetical protein
MCDMPRQAKKKQGLAWLVAAGVSLAQTANRLEAGERLELGFAAGTEPFI